MPIKTDPSDYLRFDGVRKNFPGVCALDGIKFGLREGCVNGLVGENGAGKSTLLKILSGAYAPDSGHLEIDGKPVVFRSTQDAIQAGIAVIYQELNLVPDMSVEENMMLGHMPKTLGLIDRKSMRSAVRLELEKLGESIDPTIRVRNLSIAQRQMLEISKALMLNAKVIAFDEPTSSLTDREVRKLFEVIIELKKKGCCILYVSHRLEEIFRICDAVTILRDGRMVEDVKDMHLVDYDFLVSRMVGRSIQDVYGYRPRSPGEEALAVSGIFGKGLREPASFSVRKGEIVGFFGLVGAGRSELMKLIFGAEKIVAGKIAVDGREVAFRNPRGAIKAGIVLCPEDRKYEGIIPVRSVAENINISIRRLMSLLGFFIDSGREKKNAMDFTERLNIRTPSLEQLIAKLSGGNQQKAILARWLSEDVKVILMDEPTRGIDIGTKSEIYSIIYELAGKGVAVVVVSSELPEVLGVSDRIIVMREGRIVASVPRAEADQDGILKLALPQADNRV
jgi:L-arabinose transport system ATP-binding protein